MPTFTSNQFPFNCKGFYLLQQESSKNLSLSAFCLFKLWHLRNVKVWSMCFSFLFSVVLVIPATQQRIRH